MLIRVLYNINNTESVRHASEVVEVLTADYLQYGLITVTIPVSRAPDQTRVWVEIPINVPKSNLSLAKELANTMGTILDVHVMITDDTVHD